MTRTTTPTTELSFELDHFEWTAADRLEVSGRWFGVRGRRFVRPTLTLRADGKRRRLIAVLDHKPWAADGDGAWTAAFAWRGERGEVAAARLEVAPDVVLELPAPGDEAAGAVVRPRPKKARAAEGGEDASRAAEDAPSAAAEPPAPTRSDAADASLRAHAASAAADLEQRLAEERAERERVSAALRDAQSRIAALDGQLAELATARERAGAAERELSAAQDRSAVASGDIGALRRRMETLERERAEERAAFERDLAAARDQAARDVAAAQELAAATASTLATAERELAASRDHADAVELELEAAGDIDALHRRAETAEREAAALHERLERTPPAGRAVPEAVLAARGVAPRRRTDWAARIVGVISMALLAIVVIAILQLLL